MAATERPKRTKRVPVSRERPEVKKAEQEIMEAAARIKAAEASDAPVEIEVDPVAPAPKRQQTQVKIILSGKMAELYLGKRSVQDMDNEELARMQFKDVNGNFRGQAPKNLPRTLVQSIREELLHRASVMFDGSLLNAIEVLSMLASNDDIPPKDRLRAASMIIERVMGKTPDKIEIGGGDKPIDILLSRIERKRPTI